MALVQTSQRFQLELEQLADAQLRGDIISRLEHLRGCASDPGIVVAFKDHRPYVKVTLQGMQFICADLRRLDGRLLVVRAFKCTKRGLQTLVVGGISREYDFQHTVDMVV